MEVHSDSSSKGKLIHLVDYWVDRDKSIMIGSNTFMGAAKEVKTWNLPIGPKFQLHNIIQCIKTALPPSELTASSFMSEATCRQSFT